MHATEDLEKGLTTAEAARLLAVHGKNSLQPAVRSTWLHILAAAAKEPMFILLSAACLLYFLLGQWNEGFLMLAAMTIMTGISIIQETRSEKALDALRQYMEPKATVVRDGAITQIPAEELVPGDTIMVEEGERIPADASVLTAHDLSVNESLLTGESIPVEKLPVSGKESLYQGSTVNSGMCYAKVTATGAKTLLGKIGTAVQTVEPPPTRLQSWIIRFVRTMTIFGLSGFVLVWLVKYLQTGDFSLSILTGLTLAMSAIPEEIPVAFSSFMALGAWRMASRGIVVRHPRIVESLGAVTVICLDKTGTLTKNSMQVKYIYDASTGKEEEWKDGTLFSNSRTLWFARLACEQEPFDAMEVAIVDAFDIHGKDRDYKELHMVHEYPVSGRPPMMTHVYQGQAGNIVAAKGAPERIIRISQLSDTERLEWKGRAEELAAGGYRVLAVCSAIAQGDYPDSQDNFNWQFEGLIAIFDPPKNNLAEVFNDWRNAGIDVKIISGDFPATVLNIARLAGMDPNLAILTGDEVLLLSPAELKDRVRYIDIYARMFPEAKTKVIETLKENGETVVMSGDGVNDAPALRSAHVGMAMGKRGTQLAREAADLVISDDDLSHITQAIQYGRTIRANLAKAVRYLITIHIPVILTASMPLLLGWQYPTIFSPIHIIFLELIMGPTCSIFYEREPAEKNIMSAPQQSRGDSLFRGKDLALTISLGLSSTLGLLIVYHGFMHNGYTLAYIRTMVFITLLLNNILLTFSCRSTTRPIFPASPAYHNPLTFPVLLLSFLFLIFVAFIPFGRHLFQLTDLFPEHYALAAGVSILSIGWFEIYKYFLSGNRTT